MSFGTHKNSKKKKKMLSEKCFLHNKRTNRKKKGVRGSNAHRMLFPKMYVGGGNGER